MLVAAQIKAVKLGSRAALLYWFSSLYRKHYFIICPMEIYIRILCPSLNPPIHPYPCSITENHASPILLLPVFKMGRELLGRVNN